MEVMKMQRIKIVKDEFSMIIPEGFDVMPDNIAEYKYPAKSRPSIILTNDTATVDYKFSYILALVSEEALSELVNQTKTSLRRIFTGIKFYEENVVDVNGIKLGWFDYVSPAIGGIVYNISFLPKSYSETISFFTWIKGKLLHGTFSCENSIEEWKDIFLESIMSIKEEIENE